MRRPPSYLHALAYPATAGTALLCLAVALLGLLEKERIEPLVIGGQIFCGEPWRVVTTGLVHGGPLHLLFNLSWLWVFGTAIERRFGSVALLLGMLLCQVASLAAEYAFFGSGIGLSGVGYGLFGFAWMLAKYDPRERDLVDDRTIAMFLIWGVICVVATVTGTYPVANVAHGVGLAFGVCTGLAVVRTRAWLVAALAIIALSVLGVTHGREYVNLARVRAANELIASEWSMRERNLACAVQLAEKAVRLDRRGEVLVQLADVQRVAGHPTEARATFAEACTKNDGMGCGNLGIMLELGEGGPPSVPEAIEAYRKACDHGSQAGCKNHARFDVAPDAR